MAGFYDEVGFDKGPSKRALLLPGETVTVYQDSAGTQSASLQALFSDELLTVPLANPFTADTLGNIAFWADAIWAWVKVGDRPARRVRLSQVGPIGPQGPPGDVSTAQLTAAVLPKADAAATAWDNFDAADGPLSGRVSPSGHTWTTSGAAPPTISSGAMVSTGIGYGMLDLGTTVASWGAEWTIDPGATTSVMAIICSIDPGVGLLNMVHPIISSASWVIQLRQAGGTFDVVASGAFVPPLATDGATIHRAAFSVKGDTLYCFLPDGTTKTVTDARISDLVGPRVIWEPVTNADGSQKPRVKRVFAETIATNAHSSGFATLADVAQAGAMLDHRKLLNGTAATPAIAPEADTDTGIYFIPPNTMLFVTGGAIKLQFGASLTTVLQLIVPNADAGQSLGATALRWANVHAVTSNFTNAMMAGYIQGTEIADPGPPSANIGRLYFRDNGSGKTQLAVRFPTGAIQVIATEP